jgi:hypothetical protein
MKRSATVCFLVLFSLLFSVLPANAADVAAPELVSANLTTPKSIGPGENICIDLSLREATSVDSVIARFDGPYGRTMYATSYSPPETSDGIYDVSICTSRVENDSWPSGTYQLAYLWLYDTAGNNTSTLREHAAVLNPADFAITVRDTTADVAAPELVSANLTTPKSIGPGENICIDLSLREATGVDSVIARFDGPYGRTMYATSYSPPETSDGIYDVSICTSPVENDSWPSGTYQLAYLWLYDTAGNNTSTLREHAAVLNPADFAITVRDTTADVAAPELVSANLTTPKSIGPGENICIDLSLREATGVDSVIARFDGPYGRTMYATSYSPPETSDGIYDVSICTSPVENDSWPSGTYQLAYLWLYDTAGNNTSTLREHAAVLNPADFAITVRTIPYQVTPAGVVYTDNDGTSQDSYTIPATDGVEYQVGGNTIAAGTYPGTGTVTVTAKAKTDYVLTGTTEWTTTFKATPYQVIPSPVVFTDLDGTAKDSYTVPTTDGVDYQIGGNTVEAGTYPGTGTVTVTAKAKTDYVLTGTTEWTTTFKATPYQVIPSPVVFTDLDGTAKDSYTVPTTDGVDYQIGGNTVEAGTYPGTGTVTVTAKAKTDYVLTGTTEWTATFIATPYQVVPAPVVFNDLDGAAEDSYTMPTTDGVDYQIGGNTVEAGTYPGTGTVTVTAKVKSDYDLSGTTEWTATFIATPYQVIPAPVVFSDQDGAAEDSYTIPTTDGVDYQIGGKTVAAGTYPGTGTVTVTAKAKTDYVLSGTTEWTTTFKASPYQATTAPVIFTDNDGTSQDTYTIPTTDGVDYQIGGKTTEAGTHPGTGTVTVTAKARTDYVLTGTTEWTATFKATPYHVTPAPVVFTNNDGTSQDSYTIPVTEGVDYLINNAVAAAGTYPGTGTVTVAAKAPHRLRPDRHHRMDHHL